MFYKLFLTTIPIFLVIDFLWVGVLAKNFYKQQIGFLLSPNVNWPAAIVFYLIFTASLVIFVIAPAVEKKSLLSALKMGALFGLVTYATYDLTNLALTKNWSYLVTVVDLIWGACLSALVSVCVYVIANKFFQ